MELMVLSFLIADYDILREKTARQPGNVRSRETLTPPPRDMPAFSLSLALAPSPFKHRRFMHRSGLAYFYSPTRDIVNARLKLDKNPRRVRLQCRT